jgi:hypothetical protein
MEIKTLLIGPLSLLLLTCPFYSSIAQENYFGQKPPGLIPEIFAPGIVSLDGRYEYGISFTPELNEVYFTTDIKDKGTSIYFSKIENGEWSKPKRANLTEDRMSSEMEPHVTFNGERIYFTAFNSGGYKIWFVTRLDGIWSTAEMLNSPINSDNVMYPNTEVNGDIYYTNLSKLKMFYSKYQDGKYPEVFEVGNVYGLNGFIDPLKRFMLLDAPKENNSSKDRDIYVCFRNIDSTWTKPINLGKEVNTIYNETCASVSPDGKYLFFSRYNETSGLPNIYWVSSEIIRNIEPENQ